MNKESVSKVYKNTHLQNTYGSAKALIHLSMINEILYNDLMCYSSGVNVLT